VAFLVPSFLLFFSVSFHGSFDLDKFFLQLGFPIVLAFSY